MNTLPLPQYTRADYSRRVSCAMNMWNNRLTQDQRLTIFRHLRMANKLPEKWDHAEVSRGIEGRQFSELDAEIRDALADCLIRLKRFNDYDFPEVFTSHFFEKGERK
jgi:hypothetical protein